MGIKQDLEELRKGREIEKEVEENKAQISALNDYVRHQNTRIEILRDLPYWAKNSNKKRETK